MGIGNDYSNPLSNVKSALFHWQVSHSLKYIYIYILDNKPLLKEKHKPFKQEKPIVKFPDLKSGTSLKVNKEKPFIDKIEDMLKDLVKPKQEQPSSSKTLSVTKIPESSENSSETESYIYIYIYNMPLANVILTSIYATFYRNLHQTLCEILGLWLS
jgi:hypothetical protein